MSVEANKAMRAGSVIQTTIYESKIQMYYEIQCMNPMKEMRKRRKEYFDYLLTFLEKRREVDSRSGEQT